MKRKEKQRKKAYIRFNRFTRIETSKKIIASDMRAFEHPRTADILLHLNSFRITVINICVLRARDVRTLYASFSQYAVSFSVQKFREKLRSLKLGQFVWKDTKANYVVISVSRVLTVNTFESNDIERINAVYTFTLKAILNNFIFSAIFTCTRVVTMR